MGRVRRKLRSQRGASLMVALLFFVMMAVIGSVILAAASAGMGRVKDEDEGDQERYALYSAAKMIEKAFAGQYAFKKITGYTEDNHQLVISAASPISYYVDSNGANYSDHELTQPLGNPLQDISWIDPQYDTSSANDLKDIQEILAEQLLKAYWDERKKNVETWNLGSTENWNDVVEEQKDQEVSDSESVSDSHKIKIKKRTVSFTITPDSKWTEKAEEEDQKYQVVQADMTMKPNFDIQVKLHLKDKSVSYQTYTVEIPFADNAQIVLGNKTVGDPYSVSETVNGVTRNKYGQPVTINGSVTFKNFQWQGQDQVKITTLNDDDSGSESADAE